MIDFEKLVNESVLEMENYIEENTNALKNHGVTESIIQSHRSGMQHAVVMMRYTLIEKYKSQQ